MFLEPASSEPPPFSVFGRGLIPQSIVARCDPLRPEKLREAGTERCLKLAAVYVSVSVQDEEVHVRGVYLESCSTKGES